MDQPKKGLENGDYKIAWSGDEFEHVPLKQRLKLLLSNYGVTLPPDFKFDNQNITLGESAAGKRVIVHRDSKFGCSDEGQMIETVHKEGRRTGELGGFFNQENLVNKCVGLTDTVATATSEKVDSVGCSSLHQSLFVKSPVTVKVECTDNLVESSTANFTDSSSLAGTQAAFSFEPDLDNEYNDELEHVVLKERLRRLLASRCLGSTSTKLEEKSAGTVRVEKQFEAQRHVVSGNQILASDSLGIQTNDMICSTEKECFNKYESVGGNTFLSAEPKTVQGSAVTGVAQIKIEPPGFEEFQGPNVAALGQMSFSDLVLVKTEIKTADDGYEDELDHMLLRDRMKLLSSNNGPSLDTHQSPKCVSKTVPSAFDSRPIASTPVQSFKVSRPRKRRKTVTDSIETAMEEDAPGLLKVLIDKGVSVDEIKLYGEPESDDALDDSSTNENFTELEEVITKLFTQRDSLLKLGPLRCSKGEKASYCLECLLSLVEQARYLQFRKWPVEWGWCRDLQSFIFVFERHNRIVLERPEYGYATYFFELADSLPINWQIKRLVTAMKLTNCSRITIIENKALMVGDDLTEGQARVLMEYGWIPNTGLGTMLNYYDRVVHDRRNEKDRSEWRSKIGKLLAEGYNGGTIIPAGIPLKVVESDMVQPVEIKLEYD